MPIGYFSTKPPERHKVTSMISTQDVVGFATSLPRDADAGYDLFEQQCPSEAPGACPEDRGHPVYLWLYQGGAASFEYRANAKEKVVVSAPIGWTMVSDSYYGAVMESVYGQVLAAQDVYSYSKNMSYHFKIKSREDLVKTYDPGPGNW